ncbi:MAG: aspartate kinase [Myxococcales bacterium]|nr:aspartate kinase [Myxococcales bacterium]
MIVMKFGGSSVANREQIEKVLTIVRDRLDQHPVVVCSAHKGVTDALIDAARLAASGRDPGEAVIERQRAVADSLGCDPDLLAPCFSEIRDLLRGIRLVGELSPRSLDYISSFGERMSVRCIADFFSRQGMPTRAFDAWDLGLRTDDNFGRARPLPGYAEAMQAAFAERVPPGVVALVTGFVAKGKDGVITTLGRNGSDLTATLVGAALGAREVQIWSDTDGVMSADPSIVPAAKSIAAMRFDEAAELAYFGSRVLHPATLVPAIDKDIPVRVLNTNRPDHPGTLIESAPTPKPDPVTSIAYKEGQGVLTIMEPRMFEQVGFLARFFEILARREVVVDLVATSEVSVSITSHDCAALHAVVDELRPLGQVEVKEGKTILAVVGRHIQHSKGIGARVLSAISAADVNVEMHTFGMSSNNMSLVIDDSAIARAVASLHAALFE